MMGKKIEDAGAKKECPSCGLGVTPEANICEFCGWDFEEEDEWILQIEKLERDLMLEKQKFEPGTVDHKIESTLHTPALERIEMIRDSQNSNPNGPIRSQAREPSPAGPSPGTSKTVAPVAGPRVRQIRAEAPAPTQSDSSQRVRKVRSVKGPSGGSAPQPIAQAAPIEGKKTRTVRKVKQ